MSPDWASAREWCFREALGVLRDPEWAEEAAQEALARAWRHRASCRRPDAWKPWVRSIARNEAIRAARTRSRRSAVEVADPAAVERHAAPDERHEVLGRVALGQLLAPFDEDERRLIRLRYVDDLSQPRIARLLDAPEGTIKVRLHRLRRRLRQLMEDGAEA